jgi:cysteinyl-tRNA synthetase
LNLAGYYKGIEEALNDDFNSPKALAVIFDFVRDANKTLNESEHPSKEFLGELMSFLRKTAVGIFGIIQTEKSETVNPTLENELIELLINIRTHAKAAKNFQLSDTIRDELKKLGIVLQDSKEKTTYKKQD